MNFLEGNKLSSFQYIIVVMKISLTLYIVYIVDAIRVTLSIPTRIRALLCKSHNDIMNF